MNFPDELVLVKYAQGLVLYKPFLNSAFLRIELLDKQQFLKDVIQMAFSNEIKKVDYSSAIDASELDESVQAVLLFKKGVTLTQMELLTKLPEKELEYSFRLLIELFTVTYQRRYKKEKRSPKSWQYRDLSSTSVILDLLEKIDPKDLPKSRHNRVI